MRWRRPVPTSVLGSVLWLAACAGDEPGDAGIVFADAGPPISDAGSDAGVECLRAEDGFPRALGLPMPEPDGVFDPDLVRDPETGRAWISYSAVDGPPGSGLVSTHLAYTDDDGQTWCYAGLANRSEAIAAEALPAGVTGTNAHWSHETSAIVHDPGAAPGARWRQIWHRYLHVDEPGRPDGRRFEYGWIAQRVAPTPEGLLAAPEQKLFSAAAYYASPAVAAYNDAAPGGTPEVRLDRDADLGSCLIFTEPAPIAADGALYLALFCASSATDRSIVLLRLDHPGETWSFAGTLFAPSDAATVDATYDGFNAPDLTTFGDGHRILVTPITADRYRGCIAFDVDLATGTVRDDGGDGPDALFTLPLGERPEAPFGGACTFLEGSAMGLIYGEVRTTSPAFTLTASGNTTL